MNRREFNKTLAAGAASAFLPSQVFGQDKGRVVFAGYGGRAQNEGQKKAYFEPFEKATGIRVVDTTGISLAKIRAMVKSGNVEWDVFQGVPNDVFILGNAGMLEEIDYSKFSKDVLQGMPADTRFKYGVGHYWSSQVIAFNTKSYPAGKPRPASWKDFWDVKRFPGKRGMTAGDYVVPPIEPALLADGVSAKELYPIDLDRAYRSLDAIRPHVVKWGRSTTEVPAAIVDGEVDIGYGQSARIQELKDQGAPIDFVWDQGLINHSYMAIPKGSKNYQNALQFINFISGAERMAAICRSFPYGPVNAKALDLLAPKEREKLNSYGPNLAKQIRQRPDWWIQADASGRTNWDRSVQRWLQWTTAR
jgi:putative spermidine/putrescine transport system substrate-binding protein